VEQNYEIHDKEMLAITQALEEWRHFLEGLTSKEEEWDILKDIQHALRDREPEEPVTQAVTEFGPLRDPEVCYTFEAQSMFQRIQTSRDT